VDTNIAMTANNANPAAGAGCVAASAKALLAIRDTGHVFIDDGGRIEEEYRRNLNAKGQLGPGDLFFRWLLDNQWGGKRVTRVKISPRSQDDTNFDELPDPPQGITYDPSDRKFLAGAAAHPDHPSILQSFDSKWWGWRDALTSIGVHIHFLCQQEIQQKHRQKMKG
jgi:hypothetical protein